MKRDMDLIREILLKLEAECDNQPISEFTVNGYSLDVIAFHCVLLRDAHLISSAVPCSNGAETLSVQAGPLTWDGYEYLEKIRSAKGWAKIKRTIKDHAIPFAFETINTVASAMISSAVEGAMNAILTTGGQM